jgi:hypothetical protein
MKTGRLIGTGALFLLLGSTAPAYAQQEEHKEEAKPPKQEEKAPAAKPPVKQEEHPQPAKQEEKAKPAPQERQAPPAKQQEDKQEQKTAQKPAQTEHTQPARQAAKPAAQPHVQQAKTAGRPPVRTKEEEERQRSAPAIRVTVRTQTRIPDDRFRANFGSGHRFVVGTPRIVGGYSRFQYGGFWFGFVQPWPVGWYYTDQVYVDYVDGGYFLFNPFYPGVRIAITVVG